MVNKNRALVVMSGGQDSTTCLGVALRDNSYVEAVSFNYGQKHAIELEVAATICKKVAVPLTVIDVPALQKMTSSALVNGGDVNAEHAYLEGRPASFVPARNALFLTMAFGIAMERGLNLLYTGVCQTDYSGYPDCRDIFIKTLNTALRVGYETDIHILTPLMDLTKAQTFKLAEEVGVLDLVLEHSHTCYNGSRTPNDWGKGCGECGACKLRARGYEEYLRG